VSPRDTPSTFTLPEPRIVNARGAKQVFASAGAYRIIVVPVVLVAVGIIVAPPVPVVVGIVVGVAVVLLGVGIIVVLVVLVVVGVAVVPVVLVAVVIIVVPPVRIAVGVAAVTRCPMTFTTALPCRARPGVFRAVIDPVAANAPLVASATPSRPAAAATPSLMDVFMSVPFFLNALFPGAVMTLAARYELTGRAG
jgi:hypothetical protein